MTMPSKKPELTARGKRVTRTAKSIQKEKQAKKEEYKTEKKPTGPSAAIKREIWLALDRKCHLCGRRIVLIENCQIDHVRPHAIGGENSLKNYLPICITCNGIKKHSTPRQIRQALRIGMWALTQIRNSSPVGIQMANKYNKKLE